MRFIVLVRSNSVTAAPIKVARSLAAQIISMGIRVDFFYLKQVGESLKDEFIWDGKIVSKLQKGDVVHTHGIRCDLYMAFLKITRQVPSYVPWISTVHCNIAKDMSDLLGKFLGKLISCIWVNALKRADHVIFLSNEARKSAKFPKSHSSVIRNGLAQTEVFDYGPPQIFLDWHRSIKKTDIVLGTFAAARPLKGIDLMIKAVAKNRRFRFFLAGDGPELGALKKLAVNLGVQDRCLFLGYVNSPVSLLNYCDVYLNCSKSEGSPLSVLEALRAGVPIVAPRIPPFTEFLDDGIFELYKFDIVEDLVSAIENTVIHHEEISRACRKLFNKEFQLESIARIFINKIEKLIPRE